MMMMKVTRNIAGPMNSIRLKVLSRVFPRAWARGGELYETIVSFVLPKGPVLRAHLILEIVDRGNGITNDHAT